MTCLTTSVFKRHSDNGKADNQQNIFSNIQTNKKKIKGKSYLFNILQIDWEVLKLECTERNLSKRNLSDQKS